MPKRTKDPARTELLKQIRELGEAYGRLQSLVEGFTELDLTDAEQFESATFIRLEKLVTQIAGKSAVRTFTSGVLRALHPKVATKQTQKSRKG